MERNENGLSMLFQGRGSSPERIGASENGGGTVREGCGGNTAQGGTVREGCGGNTAQGGCGMGGCANASRRQLAMVYAPLQCFRMLYNHSDALMRGTLFEELDKPLEEAW